MDMPAMEISKNVLLHGADDRPFLLDFYPAHNSPADLIVFCHGFKGFKDWGCWEQMALWWNEQGFHFIKFNYSHNGTTPDQPMDFADLEAFGHNTFSKELYDLEQVLQWVTDQKDSGLLQYRYLHLIGHSRSGPIVLIKGLEDERVTSVTTWAAVSRLDRFVDDKVIQEWNKKGVVYVFNSRTEQYMPLYRDIYDDFIQNRHRLDLTQLQPKRELPIHIVHGDQDETVPIEDAFHLKQLFPWANVSVIPGMGHSFGCTHPPADTLPQQAQQLLHASLAWLKDHFPHPS